MTTYSVSTDAQPLFPDGYNDSMTLYNQGPWTIFIDDNSSVGPQSYALKPSTSMVWPQGIPLWVKGNQPPSALRPTVQSQPFVYALQYQNSTLVATRGSYAAASQFSTKSLFTIRRSAYTENSGFLFSADYPFEADSFDSLVITLYETPWKNTGDNVSITQTHSVDILWFDELGNLVTTDRYNLLYQGYNSNDTLLIPQRIITPVIAKYCLITHANYDFTVPVQGRFNWLVQGSTESLNPRVDQWVWQTAIDNGGTIDNTRFNYSPIWIRNQNNGGTQIAGLFLGNDSAYVDVWQVAQPIHCNNVTRNLQCSFRASGITTAGSMVVRTTGPNSGNQILSLTNIATGSAVYTASIQVPLSEPIRIQSAGGLVGAMNVSLVWS